ncbi:MAG: hypothetical protein ACD_56C00116G0006 [uncultured bacterium]|nr:MAG: hypothetical protein ACD_56C00116G0006 [uncultured bacterium]
MKKIAIEFLQMPSIEIRPAQDEFLEEKRPLEQFTDEEIVSMAKENKEYFGFLVERYERKMKIYIKRITGASNETVEDVVQEVFFKVYANIDKFNQEMKFSSWIYRIAHNQAVNNFLYEKRRRTESLLYNEKGELITMLRDSHDIWREIQQGNINEKLVCALSHISKKYKDVIELNYFYGKSYQEISQELGKPVNTIGTMLNRGRKILKKELIKMGVVCDIAMVQMEKDFSFKG